MQVRMGKYWGGVNPKILQKADGRFEASTHCLIHTQYSRRLTFDPNDAPVNAAHGAVAARAATARWRKERAMAQFFMYICSCVSFPCVPVSR